MTQHMEADARSLLVRVWDLKADNGPLQLIMRSVNARDALARDPERYVLKLPRGVKPGPAHLEAEARRKEEANDYASIAARDPVFGNLGANS